MSTQGNGVAFLLPLTPSEQRIWNLLKDGRPHRVAELQELLWDELSSRGAVWTLVCCLRKKLPPGIEIVCINDRRASVYRLIRPFLPA